jgi:hypothetical protein
MQSDVVIAKAKFVGSLFKKNSARVLGHDGAYSIPLKNGMVFWTFGDTLIGPAREGFDPQKVDFAKWLIKDPWAKKNIRMISNTGLIAEHKKIQELMHGGFQYYVQNRKINEENIVEAREIIPVPEKIRGETKERMAFWPFDGIDVDGRLYLFYFMVKCLMSQMKLYGVGLAKSTSSYESFERLYSANSIAPKDLDENEKPYVWWDNSRAGKNIKQMPGFGTAVLKKIISGYVYIYGSKLEKMHGRAIHGVSLSRVRRNKIEDVSKYEYMIEGPSAGNDFEPKWGDNPRESVVIFDGNANELSVSYNLYLKKYLAIYSYSDTIYKKRSNDEIHMRVADKPEGPWGSPIIVYKPRRSYEKDFCYAAKEHPEYSQHGRTIYVTYVSHQRYFPELVEIQLSSEY